MSASRRPIKLTLGRLEPPAGWTVDVQVRDLGASIVATYEGPQSGPLTISLEGFELTSAASDESTAEAVLTATLEDISLVVNVREVRDPAAATEAVQSFFEHMRDHAAIIADSHGRPTCILGHRPTGRFRRRP